MAKIAFCSFNFYIFFYEIFTATMSFLVHLVVIFPVATLTFLSIFLVIFPFRLMIMILTILDEVAQVSVCRTQTTELNLSLWIDFHQQGVLGCHESYKMNFERNKHQSRSKFYFFLTAQPENVRTASFFAQNVSHEPPKSI